MDGCGDDKADLLPLGFGLAAVDLEGDAFEFAPAELAKLHANLRLGGTNLLVGEAAEPGEVVVVLGGQQLEEVALFKPRLGIRVVADPVEGAHGPHGTVAAGFQFVAGMGQAGIAEARVRHDAADHARPFREGGERRGSLGFAGDDPAGDQ